MKPKIRDIIMESPSGKAEDWLSRQKDIEWAKSVSERPAKEKQLSDIGVEPVRDTGHFVDGLQQLKKSRAFVGFMEKSWKVRE